jgi:hypothetical protein
VGYEWALLFQDNDLVIKTSAILMAYPAINACVAAQWPLYVASQNDLRRNRIELFQRRWSMQWLL